MSEQETTNEKVLLPKHYARWPLEPIFFAMVNSLDYARGNILKYIMRWDAKDGLKDLYKAGRYLDQYTTMEEEKAEGVDAQEMIFWRTPSLADALRRYIKRNDVQVTDKDLAELSNLIDELSVPVIRR